MRVESENVERRGCGEGGEKSDSHLVPNLWQDLQNEFVITKLFLNDLRLYVSTWCANLILGPFRC